MDSDIENQEPSSPSRFFNENERRKRSTEELLFSTPKRPRSDNQSRKEWNENEVPVVPNVPVVKYRRVLHHLPQDIPYIPITTETGGRVYLRILGDKKRKSVWEEEEGEVKLLSTEDGSNRRLFPEWEKIKNDARVLKDTFHKNLEKIVDNDDVLPSLGVEKSEALWVEKYKPKSYLDLLSEESINKSLLHWLKLWDKSVFGNDFLAKVKELKEKYKNLEAKEKEILEKKRIYKPPAPQIDEYDEHKRPKFKVALLYGPPGLGKTTCAHIVAKQADYIVREMNASDDRSVEIFQKVLDDVTTSRSETFQGKPNCLVIDEIDGAPLAAVNVLIQLITGNATEKGKNKTKKELKRPVICICNDLYAPSLKELRKHAFLLHFTPLTVARLAERLEQISLKEKLNLDTGTIQCLCEKSECDIRSCLSTLQFLKKKKCTQKDAIFSQIGVKDKSKGLFGVWHDIFMLPDAKKRYDVEDPTKPATRFQSVLRTVGNYGEFEKLLDGVFENYLKVKFKDCYFESIIEGLSWTTWFHELNDTILTNQNYVLQGYLPLYFVMCHFLFAQRSWFQIGFPSANSRYKVNQNRSVLSSLLSDITPSIGRYLDTGAAVVELFPALMTIIQPSTIRPVPTQMWSARERETLKNIVEIMISYNLFYNQIKNKDGAYEFMLEPDIASVSKFKEESQVSKRSFPYAVKQLVAREIETEKMRRNDFLHETTTAVSNPEKILKPCKSEPQELKAPIARLPLKTTPKTKIDPTAAMATDFFGRPVAPSAQNTQDLLALQRRSSGIYFRFKEGYSNAVRRFVKTKDLL